MAEVQNSVAPLCCITVFVHLPTETFLIDNGLEAGARWLSESEPIRRLGSVIMSKLQVLE